MSGREPPRLLVVLPLEAAGRLVLDAETYEDERRLIDWLRRSGAFADLAVVASRLLDDLDQGDAA